METQPTGVNINTIYVTILPKSRKGKQVTNIYLQLFLKKIVMWRYKMAHTLREFNWFRLYSSQKPIFWYNSNIKTVDAKYPVSQNKKYTCFLYRDLGSILNGLNTVWLIFDGTNDALRSNSIKHIRNNSSILWHIPSIIVQQFVL